MYYNEDTGQEIGRSGVEEAVRPTALKENWLPCDVINKGFTQITETPQPDITNLQVVNNGGVGDKIDDTRPRVWVVSDRFQDIPGGLTKAEQDAAFLIAELATAKITQQDTNKASCTTFILEHYSEPIQRSAALGVYSQEYATIMADHIANIIEEENRVWDLLEAAKTMEDLSLVESPKWPEV